MNTDTRKQIDYERPDWTPDEMGSTEKPWVSAQPRRLYEARRAAHEAKVGNVIVAMVALTAVMAIAAIIYHVMGGV